MQSTIPIYDVSSGQIKNLLPVKKTDEEWREILNQESFRISRLAGTETAYTGRYHDNHSPGLYRCVCCGTDLFRSVDKFNSGTGWPSFSRPVSDINIKRRTDQSHGMIRIEVLCARCDAHLGHLFDDGPLRQT